MSLLVRRLSIIGAVIVLFGGAIAYRALSQLKKPPVRVTGQLALPRVSGLEIKKEPASFPVMIQGELVAYEKIDLFSEVTGTLKGSQRPFKEGNRFKRGELLLELDDDEARLNLLSQKSVFLNTIASLMPDLKVDYADNYEQWERYFANFDIADSPAPLPDPATEREKRFVASRNLLNQYYSIKSAESRLGKYRITAPFSGVVTEASVNQGAVVRAGQKVGELMNTGRYELQATVPLSELHNLSIGQRVNLSTSGLEGQWTGKVSRISDQVDPLTQSVSVFIEVRGEGLREGMYLKGELNSIPLEDVVKIPKNILLNQKAVYVIQDTQLIRVDVELLRIHGDTALITGLAEGTLLLDNPMPSAYDGMVVRLDAPQD